MNVESQSFLQVRDNKLPQHDIVSQLAAPSLTQPTHHHQLLSRRTRSVPEITTPNREVVQHKILRAAPSSSANGTPVRLVVAVLDVHIRDEYMPADLGGADADGLVDAAQRPFVVYAAWIRPVEGAVFCC